MLDISSLAIDVEKSEEGQWFPFLGTDAKFKVRRFNNDKAELLQSQLTLDNWEDLTGDDREKAERVEYEIRARVLAEEVLVDWKGLGQDGEELKYTPEVGFKFLSDKKYVDLRKFIERTAMNASNWRAKNEDAAAESVKDTAAS